MFFAASGATFTNTGTVSGGNGGFGGGAYESAGAGGVGVVGAGLTIVDTGTIAGGLGTTKTMQGPRARAQADAIDFTGGANTLALGTDARLTGDIAVEAGTLTFDQDATADGSGPLPVNLVFGTTIVGAGAVIKAGRGRLTLSGANTFSGGTSVQGGILALDHKTGARIDAAGTGAVGVAGGQLAFDVSGVLADGLTMATGIVNLAANDVRLYGASDFGGGTLAGTSTLTDYGRTTLDGTTFVAQDETLVASGKFTVSANLNLHDTADLLISARGTYDFVGSGTISATSSNVVRNVGLIEKTGAAGRSTIDTAVANMGTIEAAAGTLDITGAVTLAGSLDVEASATLELGAMITAAQTMRFGTPGGTLKLDQAATFKATIAGFAAGDSIALTGFDDMAKVLYTAASDGGGTLTVADGSHRFSTHLDGTYSAGGFSITHTAAGETVHYKA